MIPQIAFLLSCIPFTLHSYGYAFYIQEPTNSESPAEQPSSSLLAASNSNQYSYSPQPKDGTRWTLEARGGVFFPLKEKLTHVYGMGWPAVELEMTCCLSNIHNRKIRWLLFGNGGWITKLGTTHHSSVISDLDLFPFTLGIEFQARFFGCVDFYLGAAPAYSLLRVKNYNCVRKSHIDHNAFGFMTKTGFRINFNKCFFFDLFGDYYCTRFEKLHNSIQNLENNFQGFIAGGGIGGRF